MRRCVICGHGLRDFICIEPDPENEPYQMVNICVPCAKKIEENLKKERKLCIDCKNRMWRQDLEPCYPCLNSSERIGFEKKE